MSSDERRWRYRVNDENAADRQHVLDELCRRVLQRFVGRVVTPYLMEQAELCMRDELDRAIRAGNYVLPEGLVLDRVEIGPDMRLKVFFGRVSSVAVEPEPDPSNRFEAVMAEINDMLKEESK